jgi:transcriptional regulatory protein LevR
MKLVLKLVTILTLQQKSISIKQTAKQLEEKLKVCASRELKIQFLIYLTIIFLRFYNNNNNNMKLI